MPLRKIEYNDLKLILTWRNHPSIRNNMFHNDIIPLKSHKAWFRQESEKNNACWLIYLDKKQVPSGVIYCTNIDKKNKHAFWGFYAAPGAPPGTGTSMCEEGLDYFFNVLKLNKINAEVIESNKKSHSFHRKMGFVIEGIFHQHFRINQSLESVTRYAIFLDNWLKKD